MPARLSLYDDVAQQAADVVVRRYSTSFGMASRLLPARLRPQIRNVYALVRLADEVVDGAAAEAGADVATARDRLDALERETEAALAAGYSTNVLVHAFARTAREAGFATELTRPFFASMRTDLDTTEHDAASLAAYVHGSAEVVGLMCLRVFLLDLPAGERETEYRRLERGACALGAAFQKINFLRDLADDADRLGRSYFVGVDPHAFTEAQKAEILADIRADLALARAALAELPPGSRPAVAVACGLFSELLARLAVLPAEEIVRQRVSVPTPVKLRVVARAVRAARAGEPRGRR